MANNNKTSLFYFKEDSKKYGPFNLVELCDIGIEQDSVVSMDGMNSWEKAGSIDGLLDTIRAVQELKDRLEDVENNLKDTKSSLNKKTKELTEQKNELSSQKALLAEKVTEIQELKEKLADRESGMETARNDIADMQRQLETLRKEGEKKSNELAHLQAATALVSSYITPLKHAPSKEQQVTDIMANYQERYGRLKDKVMDKVLKLSTMLPKDRNYRLVFNSPEDEMLYNMESYTDNMRVIILVAEQLAQSMEETKDCYEEDMRLLDSSVDDIRQEEEKRQEEEMGKIAVEFEAAIRELEKTAAGSNTFILDTLKTTLESKRQEVASKGLAVIKQKTSQISQTKDSIRHLYDEVTDEALAAIEKAVAFIDKNYSSPLDRIYCLASHDSEAWKEIKPDEQLPPTTLLAGSYILQQAVGGKALKITRRHFIDFLNRQHLIVQYNQKTKEGAMAFVNSILGRLLASSTPGLVNIHMFDTEELAGTSNVLTRLTPKVFSLYVREGDVKKALDVMIDHIAKVKFNLLHNPINTLQEYNKAKETKEPYHVLVLKGFPAGFRGEAVNMLNTIMKIGIDAGVHVIHLMDEDAAQHLGTEKMNDIISSEALQHCMDVNMAKFENQASSRFLFDLLPDNILHTITKYINNCFEVKEDEIIRLVDYIPAELDWWSGKSANQISIPFGLTSDRKVAKLQITQKDAQNTALVIGKPGSGKSVFLHSLICNAVVNYSPEELSLYLIDFSGVEFNTYATHKLPHARVIAPEAEREFGLSILDELVEEGARRVSKCNEYDVSNIVDLKNVKPDIKMPRILVIIDEFQKLFEVDDKINVNASTRLHIIIKEFRKFGINLILATQSLKACSGLPTDLIANRILFKSAPDDFARLIALPPSSRMPLLKNGECIYNEDSGAPYANVRAKGFFIGRDEIDKFLDRVTEHQLGSGSCSNELRVFRANELPDFASRRLERRHLPAENPGQVGIYFGESITVSDTDVNVELKKESNNSILVIGGEQEVAQRIAYHATLSATTAYADNQSACFYVFNFIREADTAKAMNAMLAATSFETVFATNRNEVTETLKGIKEEVRRRKEEEDQTARHIFLSFLAFQFSTVFEQEVKGSFNTVSQSEASKTLEYILKEGPQCGVFTILQTDNLEHVKPVGSNIHELFNYRIALQMTENESFKIVNSSIASKIFDMKRPSSKFRAYCRDKVRNTDTKFKPYK